MSYTILRLITHHNICRTLISRRRKGTSMTQREMAGNPSGMSRISIVNIILTWFIIEVFMGIIGPLVLVLDYFKAGGGHLESLSGSLFIPIGNVFFICIGLLCARISDMNIELSDRLRGGGRRRVGMAVGLFCTLGAVVTVCSWAGSRLQSTIMLHSTARFGTIWWLWATLCVLLTCILAVVVLIMRSKSERTSG